MRKYWKKRGYTPRAEVLHKIADYFGVTVDYLLGKVDLPNGLPAAQS